MSAAKNKKKSKGKTVALSDFLHDDKDLAPGFKVTHVDWADAIENEESFDRQTGDRKVVLPTAPKSSREPVVDINEVPTKPPFTAYVGNLPYDLTEEDIERFFRKMKLEVTSVRIPREGGDRGRIRGFGYAEFPDRMSLIEALALNNETLKNRSIKVSLATDHGNDTGERKDERSDRTAGDWRSGGGGGRNFEEAEPYRGRSSNEYESKSNDDHAWRSGDRDFGGDRDRGFGGDRDRGFGGDRDRGFGGDRDRGFGGDRDRGYGGDRDRGFGGDRDRGFGGDRDRGFGGDRDRGFGGDRDRGYGGDRDRGYGGDRDRGFGGDRDRGYGGDRDRGYGGDRDRGYGGDRDRGYRDRGGYERRDQGRSFGGGRSDDYQRRGGDDFPRRGGDDYTRRGNSNDDGPEDRDGPKERPKLQLKPRSVPVESESSESASSKIFGGAKPVDTAAREKEIENKLSSKEVVREAKPPTERSSIFGGAKPVDTTAREREIEEKLSKEQSETKHAGGRNRDDDRAKRPTGDRSQEFHNNVKNTVSDNSAPDRPPLPPQVVKEEPVVYTSANKFSQLMNEEEPVAEESSD